MDREADRSDFRPSSKALIRLSENNALPDSEVVEVGIESFKKIKKQRLYSSGPSVRKPAAVKRRSAIKSTSAAASRFRTWSISKLHQPRVLVKCLSKPARSPLMRYLMSFLRSLRFTTTPSNLSAPFPGCLVRFKLPWIVSSEEPREMGEPLGQSTQDLDVSQIPERKYELFDSRDMYRRNKSRFGSELEADNCLKMVLKSLGIPPETFCVP